VTAATMELPSAWWAEDIKPDQVVRIIREALPRVRAVYFGEATGKWWALSGWAGIDETWVEADTPQMLYEKIVDAAPRLPHRQVRPSGPPPWPSRRPDGRATLSPSVSAPVTRLPASPQMSREQWAPPSHREEPSRSSLYPEPGRWRRFLDRCRRARESRPQRKCSLPPTRKGLTHDHRSH
jgi:hypothetical protein